MPIKISKRAKLITESLGGWWAAMSGAVSIPTGLAALFASGHSNGFWFAILAFAALWVCLIRVVFKNYHLLKNESVKKEFRKVVSDLRESLYQMKDKPEKFISDSLIALESPVCDLMEYADDKQGLKVFWNEYQKLKGSSEMQTHLNLTIGLEKDGVDRQKFSEEIQKLIFLHLEKFSNFAN